MIITDIDRIIQNATSELLNEVMGIRVVKDPTLGEYKVKFIEGGNLLTIIGSLIGDSAPIYISDIGQVRDLWAQLETYDDEKQLPAIILSLSSRWYTKTFTNRDDYNRWAEHIATSYTLHGEKFHNALSDNSHQDDLGATISTHWAETLHQDDFKEMVQSSLWFCYLLTLALNWRKMLLGLSGNE